MERQCRFETTDWGQQKAPLDLKKPSLDLRLYAVTDPACNARCQRSNAEAVRQAVEGGVTLVQLREKSADGGAFVHEAQQLVGITRPAGVCIQACIDQACSAQNRHALQLCMHAERVRYGMSICRACLDPAQAHC